MLMGMLIMTFAANGQQKSMTERHPLDQKVTVVGKSEIHQIFRLHQKQPYSLKISRVAQFRQAGPHKTVTVNGLLVMTTQASTGSFRPILFMLPLMMMRQEKRATTATRISLHLLSI